MIDQMVIIISFWRIYMSLKYCESVTKALNLYRTLGYGHNEYCGFKKTVESR
jgi:hypothetical protein